MARTLDIKSLPDNQVYALGSTSGLEGYPNQFLKQGNQFIPISGDTSAYGPIQQLDWTPQEILVNGGGIRPLDMGIDNTRNLVQSNTAYSTALNDITTPRVGSRTLTAATAQPATLTTLPQSTGTNTGGLQFDPLQALSGIYSSRPDLQQLYDANGQAKNPNDPRVAGIPTLLDWAQQYGVNEYPNLAGNLTASAGAGGSAGISSGSSASGSTAVPTPKTGNPQYDAILDQLNQYLDKLQKNGQQINPNIQITPEQIAQFTAQASAQIHPYFASQLQAATSSFLGNLGYDVKNYDAQVKNAQTQYGRSLDSMASNLAEQGFAQSGIRLKQEGQLATDTQSSLDAARNSLLQSGQNRAAQFAQQYGGANVPGAPSVSSSRVLPGTPGFDTTQSTGLYTLDPNIYSKLIGSEQNSEKQATDTLASTLASNDQTLKANAATRSLNTI